MNTDEGKLWYGIGLDTKGLQTDAARARSIFGGIADQAQVQAGRIDSSYQKLGATIAKIGGAIGLGVLAKELYTFAGAFDKSMREVSTISETVSADMDGFKGKILAMGTEIPIAADSAAKALYQIISAGHDGAKGLQVLEVSAKAAVGGVTDTVTAADAITTMLNAYKKESSEAESISDQLFTTVRLGKTTFGELGKSISQAVPIAASFGIETEQVLAAVATLTKSGTPTAQAMTQIRASIVAASKALGDGYFQTHTFQEGLVEIANRAGGSESKLRELVPEIEAVNGVLGLTGINAKMAASDLSELGRSTGATEKAFAKMNGEAGAQLTILKNNVLKQFHEIGDGVVDITGSMAKLLNSDGLFSDSAINDVIASLVVLIATAGMYKATMMATNAIQRVGNSVQYAAEMAELAKLLPAKEASANADIEQALAKGQLSQATYERLVAIRAEVAEELKALQVKAQAAHTDMLAAMQVDTAAKDRLDRAKALAASKQDELRWATQTGNAQMIETAQQGLNNAEIERRTALGATRVSGSQLEVAQNRASATATAVDTMQTNINSAASVGAAKSKNLFTLATQKLTGAFKSLKLAFMSNPIGMILTGVTMAISLFTMFGKSAEKATDAIEEFNKKQDEQRSKVEGLIRTIQDENETLYAKEIAYKELEGLMPRFAAAHDIEAVKILKVADAQRELNKARDEAEYKNITDNVAKYSQEVDELQKKYDSTQAGGSGAAFLIPIKLDLSSAERGLDTWTDRLVQYKARVKEANEAALEPKVKLEKAQAKLAQIEKDFSDATDKLNAEQKKLEQGKILFVDYQVRARFTILKNEKEKQGDLITKEQSKLTYKQEYDAAKTEWQKAKRELAKIEKDKATYSKEQYDTAKTRADETEKAYKGLGGNIPSASAKEQKDYRDATEQALLSLEQMKVDMLQEGRAKELAQIEQTRKEKLAAIDKEQKEVADLLRKGGLPKEQQANLTQKNASLEAQKPLVGQLATNDTTAVNKKYDDEIADNWKALTSVFLSEEEKRSGAIHDEYEKRRKWLEEFSKGGSISKEQRVQFSMQIDAAEAKEQLDALTADYQTYADQRKKIEEKFNADLAALQAKNKDGKLDSNIAEVEKQKKTALSKVKVDEASDGLDFTKLFGNLDNLTLPAAKELRDKIKAWIDEAGNSLAPEDLRAVSDAFQKLEIKIADKDPFAILKSSIGELKTANEDIVASQDQVAKAQIAAQSASNILAVAQQRVTAAQKEYDEALKSNDPLKILSAQAKLSAAQNDLNNANAKGVATAKKLKEEEQNLTQAQEDRAAAVVRANEAIGSIADKGQQIVGAAQDVLGIMSDLGVKVPENIANALGGIGQIMDGLGSIDLTQPLSIVTGAVKMLGGLVKTVASLFNGDNKREAEIERLQGKIDTLSTSYDKLQKAVEKAYSTDAAKLLDQSNELIEKQKTLIKLQIAEEEGKKDTDSGKIDAWKKQIDELNQKAGENVEKKVDLVLGSDFKSDVDSAISFYKDSFGTVEKGSKDLSDRIKKNIIDGLLNKDISKAMEANRERISKLLEDDDLSEADMAEIDAMSAEITKMMDQRGKMYEGLLGKDEDADTDTREASKRGIATASQESVDENNGRLTAIQGHTYELNEGIKGMIPNIGSIRESMDFVKNNAAQQLDALHKIRDNTAPIAAMQTEIKGMHTTLEDIKINGLVLRK